jgi:hypothetical protein
MVNKTIIYIICICVLIPFSKLQMASFTTYPLGLLQSTSNLKKMVKDELIKSLEISIDKMKQDSILYSGENKEIIDNLSQLVTNLQATSDLKEEENDLKQILNYFTLLIEKNTDKEDQAKMRIFLKMIEKLLDLIIKESENSGINIPTTYSTISPYISNYIPDPKTNSKTTDDSSFSWWIIASIIAVFVLVLIAAYCIMTRRRVEKRDIESLNTGQRDTIL